MNKKAESPITIISSVLVLIVVFMVYYFFFILQGANQIELNEQVEQRGDIVLINFVKLNYNLILSSEKSGDYSDLENECSGRQEFVPDSDSWLQQPDNKHNIKDKK